MAWTLTTSLAALRRDLNATFPNRDKSSDGTIGDKAHQESTSGHNPDDTPGSKPEYSDADSKQEVRAYDADNDLRDRRGVDFQQVIDRVLATPADRDRLAYIIHRRRIWKKRNGWRREVYTGSSPHDEHAHFSGDPIHDENGAPWTSILAFKEASMAALEPTDGSYNDLIFRVKALIQGTDVMGGPSAGTINRNEVAAGIRGIGTLIGDLTAKVNALTAITVTIADAVTAGGGSIDTAAILAAVERAGQEARDAVADGLEGGATQVRADA